MEKILSTRLGDPVLRRRKRSRRPAWAGECIVIRCHSEIDSYIFTRLTFHPYGSAGGNVVLECAKCGHIELMSQTSPLLRGLTAKPAAVGDGD